MYAFQNCSSLYLLLSSKAIPTFYVFIKVTSLLLTITFLSYSIQDIISHNSGGGKYKIKALANSVADVGPFSVS